MGCLYSGVVGASWVVACSAVNLSTSLIIFIVVIDALFVRTAVEFTHLHGIDTAGHGCLRSG